MKYETLESNELIGVKLPPQEACEAYVSSTQNDAIVLYCIVLYELYAIHDVSSVQPLFQGESSCEVFVMNISFHSY